MRKILGDGYHAAVPAERQLVMLPNWPIGPRRPVIWHHPLGNPGGAGYAINRTVTPNQSDLLRGIVERGWPMLSPSFGGDLCGNAEDVLRWTSAIDYAQDPDRMAAHPTLQPIGAATSAGVSSLVTYEHQNPGTFAALLILIGVLDTQELVTRNPNGVGVTWSNQYAGGYSDETYGALNPMLHAAELDVPILLCSSVDDTVVPHDTALEFAETTGAQVVELTGEHGDAPLGQIDLDEVCEFLRLNAPAVA